MTNHGIEQLQTLFEGRASLGVAAAYVFGRWGPGRPPWEGDSGLAVLADPEVHSDAADRAALGSQLLDLLDEIKVEGPREIVILNDAPPTTGRRIAAEGRLLACHQPEVDLAFRRDALLRAADLEPFLRRLSRLRVPAVAAR